MESCPEWTWPRGDKRVRYLGPCGNALPMPWNKQQHGATSLTCALLSFCTGQSRRSTDFQWYKQSPAISLLKELNRKTITKNKTQKTKQQNSMKRYFKKVRTIKHTIYPVIELCANHTNMFEILVIQWNYVIGSKINQETGVWWWQLLKNQMTKDRRKKTWLTPLWHINE